MSQQNKPANFAKNFAANFAKNFTRTAPLQNGNFTRNFALQKPFADLDGPNRESPIADSLVFSERGQLSQAIPQFHVERMLNERTSFARFESQHNERRVCED